MTADSAPPSLPLSRSSSPFLRPVALPARRSRGSARSGSPPYGAGSPSRPEGTPGSARRDPRAAPGRPAPLRSSGGRTAIEARASRPFAAAVSRLRQRPGRRAPGQRPARVSAVRSGLAFSTGRHSRFRPPRSPRRAWPPGATSEQWGADRHRGTGLPPVRRGRFPAPAASRAPRSRTAPGPGLRRRSGLAFSTGRPSRFPPRRDPRAARATSEQWGSDRHRGTGLPPRRRGRFPAPAAFRAPRSRAAPGPGLRRTERARLSTGRPSRFAASPAPPDPALPARRQFRLPAGRWSGRSPSAASSGSLPRTAGPTRPLPGAVRATGHFRREGPPPAGSSPFGRRSRGLLLYNSEKRQRPSRRPAPAAPRRGP